MSLGTRLARLERDSPEKADDRPWIGYLLCASVAQGRVPGVYRESGCVALVLPDGADLSRVPDELRRLLRPGAKVVIGVGYWDI
jgi:hypothetical protein